MNNTNTIAEKINAIVTQRQGGAKLLNDNEKKLNKILGNCIDIIELDQNNLWKSILKDKKRDQEWNEIVTIALGFKDKILKLGLGDSPNPTGCFAMAKQRIKRGYINVGVVGPYRQGKSLVIRQMLKEIPDEDLKYLVPIDSSGVNPCTATAIDYINDRYEDKKDNTVYEKCAVLTFYNEQEIIDFILAIDGLDKEFENIINENKNAASLKDLIDKLKSEWEQYKNKRTTTYTRQELLFDMYVNGYEEYKDSLGKEYEVLDFKDCDKLMQFYERVCFYKDPAARTNDNLSRLALATKRATVYYSFTLNEKDPGKICFLDTPGVGETRKSVGETLKRALRSDIDIAVALVKTDSLDRTNIETFNEYLKTDFNTECIIDNVTYSLKDALYYIWNIVQKDDQPLTKLNLREAKDHCKSYLESSSTSKPIKLDDSHLVGIDCKRDIRYKSLKDKEELVEGSLKDVTDFTEPEENACRSLLLEILQSLERSINKIDMYFNQTAIKESTQLIEEFDHAKSKIRELNICKQSEVNEIGDIVVKISEALCKVTPKYDKDTTSDNFTKFISESNENIINNFLTEGQTKKDSISSDEYLLEESRYKIKLEEFIVYQQHKCCLREYFIKKLCDCYDTSSVENASEKAVEAIVSAFNKNGFDKLIKEEESNRWIAEFIRRYESKYSNISKRLKDIQKTDFAEERIRNYVKFELADCFHGEERFIAKFDTVDNARSVFKKWLEDIVTGLQSKMKGNAKGDASFRNMIERSRNAYSDKFDELHKSARNRNEVYRELESIIEENKDVFLAQVKEKNEIIERWNNIYEKTLQK